MTSNKRNIDDCFKSYHYIQYKKIHLLDLKLSAEDLNYLAAHPGVTLVEILHLEECTIEPLAGSQLNGGNWLNLVVLTIINLRTHGNEFYTFLAEAQAPKLACIQFPYNYIRPGDLYALRKALWPNVSIICFPKNQIKNNGCLYLANSNWNLIDINLMNNEIGTYGVRSLLQARWHNLTKLQLSQNHIGDTGCKYLSQSQWKNLKQLSLQYNKISNAGCRWLSKADWKSLCKFSFSGNYIRWEGYRHLSNCSSVKIKDLNILKNFQNIKNKLDDQGWFHLMKSKWLPTNCLIGGLDIVHLKHIKQICIRCVRMATSHQ